MARHEILGVRERPEFESLLQRVRLSFLLSPLLVLASSGPSAGAYALSIAVAVAASNAWIALLLRFKPGLLLRLQLLLRAVDCVLVYMVAVQRRDAMLAGVTHDPRSPLSVIKLQAQLLRWFAKSSRLSANNSTAHLAA